ncbi:ribbon-helix-helix protein, CopG family [Halomonas sp. TRM85114]|nr:ribbon-helix-helix protein, CopG family [Halomonas jincaotanensis]
MVYLSPATAKALDALAISTHENRSKIINRLILAAGEQTKR